MTAGTIKQYAKIKAERIKQDRPAMFFGMSCNHCACVWIVCELPQPMHRITTLTGKHKYCPACKGEDLNMATVDQVRPLLVNMNGG